MTVQRGDNESKETKGQDQSSKESGVFGSSYNQTGGAQSAGSAQQQQRSSGAGRLGGGSTARGIGRLQGLRTGMGRKRPAADLEAMQTTFEEEFKGFTNATVIPEAQNFRLLMIDRHRLGKKVDLLVAILPVVIEGKTHTAIHTMLIEDSNDQYEPVALQVAGKQLRYSTVVGDVYTAELWGTIVNVVAEASGLQIIPYDAGHQTLPAEMDVKDKDAIHKLAFFASEALTRLALNEIVKTTADVVSLTDLGENTTASATIDFRNVDDTTAGGLPLRSDFDVKLRYSEATRGGESQTEKAFDLGSQIPLGGASGFIDLSYRDPTPAAFGQQQNTQHYFANAILTRLDTDQDFITPELQLLSLLGATLIGRNLNWARVWSQQFRGMTTDMHDIGAIGYELPGPDGTPAGRIDTSSAAFDDAALARLVMTAIHDKPLISIDVEESGELSWLNRVLLDAAEGSPDANNSLIVALDNLTNNNFSRLWQGGELLVDSNNRIHLGYYIDENGIKKDLRALDYLAVLNRYSELDPQMIVKWQATYDDVDTDAEVRLAEREEMIRKILGPTVRITGFARRLTFAPDTLDKALEAAAEAGLRIRPENTLIGFGQATSRGRADLGQLAFGGHGGRGVFTSAAAGGTGRGFTRPYTGRGTWRS